MLEYISSAHFEPLPLQVPHPQIIHTPIQQYSRFPSNNNNCGSNNAPPSNLEAPAPAPGFASTDAAAMKWGDVRNFLTTAMMSGINVGPPGPVVASQSLAPAADRVLDDAVDELFNSTAVSEDVTNFDDIWDPVVFGEADEDGYIENDLQLGNLLETFLEQS